MQSLFLSRAVRLASLLVLGVAGYVPSSSLADQTIQLDGSGAGKRFDGVGAVSGGGATSVLLKDYPEPQRSQVLDLLFKPKFGASMQTLYIEVPGDGNSTQGTEPSHMRSRSDENYNRGYEWWVMAEAKKRNPAITLDACAWSCPGWVGNGNFWSQDMCDYYVSWIKGLKSVYGLDLDALGCRNERGASEPFVKMLRKTLDANGLKQVKIHAFDNAGEWKWEWCKNLETDEELRNAVDIIGNHSMSRVPTPAYVKELSDRLGKPIWDTEEHIYTDEGRFYRDDFECALGAIHEFNDNFITSGATKIVNWYLVGSVYPVEPHAQQPPAMFANSPWSAHYTLKPILWSYAHYGQFSSIGWQYMNSACGKLSDGGTYVSLKSPEGDYSIILETAQAPKAQNVTFTVAGNLSPHDLCVWRTNRQEQFIRLADIKPANGTFTITLDPDSIYSISTTTGQRKGSFPDIPAAKPFPFPYYETYDHYTDPKSWGYLPYYSADICGVFEIAERPDGQGKCLRQVLDKKPDSWAPEWMPYTVLGDEHWTDYDVSADMYLDNGGWAGVMGRINSTGNGWDGNPNGYCLRLSANGRCTLVAASQQTRWRLERQLAAGTVANWTANQWHNVKLRFVGKKITGYVDGVQVVAAEDGEFSSGVAGLATGGAKGRNSRNTALFDNLIISPPDATNLSPTVFPQDAYPIYKRTKGTGIIGAKHPKGDYANDPRPFQSNSDGRSTHSTAGSLARRAIFRSISAHSCSVTIS